MSMIIVQDFWAEWCGPCKFMESVVEEIKQELKDKVSFEKINIDEDQDLAAKYQIMSIPTFVLEKDGKEVERIIGATKKDKFIEALNKHV